MRHVASTSFGADSMAQIILAKEHDEPLDEVVYCEVMFTPEISGEIPEHRDFIYETAIPWLERELGLKTTILRANTTMWDDFHTERVRGSTKGKLRGFPIPGLCSVKRDCKLPPIKDYMAQLPSDSTQYVGIAADEVRRLKSLERTGCVSLLAKYGIDQKQARSIDERHGLLSPIYAFTGRNGCFFCPNARMSELRHLYEHHPDLWRLLRQLQETPNTSRNCFTCSLTVFDLEEKFKREEGARDASPI